MEVGKTFGTIPLGLMSVIPGNQTYFTIENTFSNFFMSLYPINMRLCNGNIIWRSLVWANSFYAKTKLEEMIEYDRFMEQFQMLIEPSMLRA
jgi:hypothetical protein